MFLEVGHNMPNSAGWIEMITGSMFSGKTEELIRRVKRAEIANLLTIVFSPRKDDRCITNSLISHDNSVIDSIKVNYSHDILELSKKFQVVAIDEAQFFDEGIIQVCNEMANKGKRVIVAGLDMDFKGNPFEPVTSLMSVAELVTKFHAICIRCGNLAHYSFRKSNEDALIVTGAQDKYEPLCRICYNKTKNQTNSLS